MSMALPRLPSGVYFNLLASSTVNNAHYVREYPTFPTSRVTEGDWDSGGDGQARHQPQNAETRQIHNKAQHARPAVVDPDLHRSAPQKPQPEQCLPLLSVAIDMQVDCTVAKTKVVQTFTNHGDISIPEAWYSFPLYDGAAVTAFRCEVGDDKVLEGKVKPKDEAKRMFKSAVKKQEAAALVEEMAPDVFQTTIGNIEPRTTVKVEIIYVEELYFDLGGDGIVVTIPTSVAPRYGMSPAGYMTNSAIKETGLSLVVSVASAQPMGNITCRSGHRVSVEYGKIYHLPEAASFEALAELQRQADSRHSPKHATIRLANSQTAIDGDIVIFIPSSDGRLLRSQALLAPPSGPNHAAMMVTVRPSELFSSIRESMDEFDGEVLFLADRSGSMEGSKIKELKDALLLFLKSLPEKCRFNLYSFGSSASSLWSQSAAYDDSTAQKALEYVSTFQADYGGTEVLVALKKAVSDRRSTNVSSTQIILLTDGEIWETEQTIEFVRMTTSKAEGQVRFFSLGIGNQVSHELIQGIGFFGSGFGEAIAADVNGKWKEAVIRMLKGAIMPNSWSYSISFGDQWRNKRLDVDDFLPQRAERNTTHALSLISEANIPSIIQAPGKIPWLHHFSHQSVYFLIDNASGELPEQVIITASSQYRGTKTATLAVIKATTNNHVIHHLAAKAAVRDLENQDTSEGPLSNQIRNKAEQLCQLYNITSKWTSFVAVGHPNQSREYEDTEVSLYRAPVAELDVLTRPRASQAKGARWSIESPTGSRVRSRPSEIEGIRLFSDFVSSEQGSNSESSSGLIREYSTEAFPESPPLEKLVSDVSRSLEDWNLLDSTQLLGWNEPARSEREFKYFDDLCDEQDDTALIPPGDELRSVTALHGTGVGVNTLQGQIDDSWVAEWQEVIRDQRVDGLFHLEVLGHRVGQHFCHGTRQALRRLLDQRMQGQTAPAAEETEMPELLVDTVMALAYLRSHFYSQQALLEILLQKAECRLTSLLTSEGWSGSDGLSAMADSALAHAHYGQCSHVSVEESSLKSGPGGGRCGVCSSQTEERLSSAMQNTGQDKCSFLGCDVAVGKWDEFWAHVVEQGHIHSSCEAARNRWLEAEVRASDPKAMQDGQKIENTEISEVEKDTDCHQAKNGQD